MPASSLGKPPLPRLPRAFGWFIRLIPGVASYRSQLYHLLGEPEIGTLLSAAPQLGRMLRPLCLMLAIKPTPDLHPLVSSILRRPPRPRRRGLPPSHEPEPATVARCLGPPPAQTPANRTPAKARLGPPHPPPDPLSQALLLSLPKPA